jgi:hypothetical protein
MWEFIKGLYFRARNAIASAYVKTIDYSMALAEKARLVTAENRSTTFKSFMLYFASFAVFCLAFIGLKVVVGLVSGLIIGALAVVLGDLLASLITLVLMVMFIIDLVKTIAFIKKAERLMSEMFGGSRVYA